MKAILHCDRRWGIGRNNDLMFHLPKDMAFFRKTTSKKVVVMGSNTLLSLPGGKPLKNRTNIVLWPDGPKERAEEDGFILVESLEELLDKVSTYKEDEVFVIGGAMLYHTLLPYCSEALVTKVDADGGAQVFFDNLDEDPDWKLVEESERVEDGDYTIVFTRYENNNVRK